MVSLCRQIVLTVLTLVSAENDKNRSIYIYQINTDMFKTLDSFLLFFWKAVIFIFTSLI